MLINLDRKYLTDAYLDHSDELQKTAASSLESLHSGHRDWSGWFHWPAQKGQETLERLENLRENFKHYYDLIVVVGIGGSYLGAKTVYEFVKPTFGQGSHVTETIFLGQNLSETYALETLDYIAKRKPLVIVISKSGSTIEPAVGYRVVKDAMNRRFGETEANERTIVVTSEKSGSLRELSDRCGIVSFPVQEDVGGRFSVLTEVGLVPLAMAGFRVNELMEGAKVLLSEMSSFDSAKGHSLVEYALIRKKAWDLGKRVEVMTYNQPKLMFFCEWWKQLFGESEGKDELGLFPTSVQYSTDLHSLGQYLQQGYPSALETFLVFDSVSGDEQQPVERRLRIPALENHKDGLSQLEGRYVEEMNQAAFEAAAFAHAKRGTPCVLLEMPRLNVFSLGYLMAYFEVACVLSSDLLGVDPFNQPGVEDYKSKMRDLVFHA